MKELNDVSPSRAVAIKTISEAFKILKEEGGQLSGKEVLDKISKRVQFSDWEKGILEKTGNIRWQSILHFYTIDCIKAGYLRKTKGIWYITPEGEQAFKKFSPVEFLGSATVAYRKWKAESKQVSKTEDAEIELEESGEQVQKANLDQLEEQAIAGIKDFINQKNPYEFQDLVAALLRAMNYYTPFVSPKGKDGGIDIIAYQDPLGVQTPRLKVQVKHYPQNPIAADAIRSLKGLINSGEEVGLFVTSGRFSPEAERFAREANVHIKLIDGDELISLWQQFYNEMNDEDKNLLPLHPVYFLGSNE
ncbi:restriction endonuclease [Chitinophagaceae bacterium LB-8]|uniref:Restriction endonuclease n=1 Tax=Paraflavisolibacter caeni TaxID=2982496 RepID=A0A9X3BIB2_9BACT|nr:restriction endonuclease [Paraflavisolibacter caeni]MCU7549833.1 restriction endonuclease [Paraflavisolibacter caeni]